MNKIADCPAERATYFFGGKWKIRILFNLFNKKIDEVLYTKDDGEQKTCRKIFELETKLFLCLVDMKFKGVRIDVAKAIEFGKIRVIKQIVFKNFIMRFFFENIIILNRNYFSYFLNDYRFNSLKIMPIFGVNFLIFLTIMGN